MVHYSTTKTTQIGLSRGLAELTQGTKVTVNSVLAGPTWTEGVKDYIHGRAVQDGVDDEVVIQGYFTGADATSLIKRFILPSEVAASVVVSFT